METSTHLAPCMRPDTTEDEGQCPCPARMQTPQRPTERLGTHSPRRVPDRARALLGAPPRGAVLTKAHLKVIFEGVGVGGAHAQGQLQQRLQAGGRDVVHWLLQLFLCEVHEVHEEVTLVHEEVALDGPAGRGEPRLASCSPWWVPDHKALGGAGRTCDRRAHECPHRATHLHGRQRSAQNELKGIGGVGLLRQAVQEMPRERHRGGCRWASGGQGAAEFVHLRWAMSPFYPGGSHAPQMGREPLLARRKPRTSGEL